MRKVNKGPLLKDDDKVRFLDSHRPYLEDGDFQITVKHSIDKLGVDAQRTFSFSIAGPRFTLKPSEVASQFPPKGSSGNFEAILPHITLNRSTLPWERTAIVEEPVDGAGEAVGQTPRNPPSWLALLVFTEEEIEGVSTILTAEQLITADSTTHAPPIVNGNTAALLRRASTDDPTTPVVVLDLPAALAKKVLPRAGDLPFLTAAREVNEKDSRAIVMANRFAHPGKRNVVHLVSLEHQYHLKPDADRRLKWTKTHEHWSRLVIPGNTVKLVSLAQWGFFCDKSKGDLQSILDEVEPSWMTLPQDGLGASAAAVFSGAVPVEHRLSTGEKTAAWYRGPAHPFVQSATPDAIPFDLPVRQSRDLVRIDNATGMADISYSAAWELGRLLALKDPSIGTRINQWKQQVVHAEFSWQHRGLAAELNDGHTLMYDPPPFPIDVQHWFDNALCLLGAVPFDYILPDEALLPLETIAWFNLDHGWINALYDGAFSVGRTSRRHLRSDTWVSGNLRYPLNLPNRSGILLRSIAVSHWPDLVVDGFTADTGELIHPVRFDYIGRDTLLVLFDAPTRQVDIHLHPQALHFGFNGSVEAGFTKKDVPVEYHHNSERVIDLAKLADTLNAHGAHDFTLKMIEGTPKRSFKFSVVSS